MRALILLLYDICLYITVLAAETKAKNNNVKELVAEPGKKVSWTCAKDTSLDKYTTNVFFIKEREKLSSCNVKQGKCIVDPRFIEKYRFDQQDDKFIMTLHWLAVDTAGEYRCINSSSGKTMDRVVFKYRCLDEMYISGFNESNGVSYGDNLTCKLWNPNKDYMVHWIHPYEDIFKNFNPYIAVLMPGNYTCEVLFTDSNCQSVSETAYIKEVKTIRYLSVLLTFLLIPVVATIFLWIYFFNEEFNNKLKWKLTNVL